MEIPVLIQEVPGKGFVATAPALGWSAEGATADEAVQSIRRRVTEEANAGRVTVVAVATKTPTVVNRPAPGENPWLRLAGTWKDDPTIDEFQRAVEEYRRQVDSDPNVY